MPITLQFEGGYNLRDLGDIPTESGQLSRKGIFIRSGGLDKLTAAGQEVFISYGVKTIIDLRNESECRDFPNVFAGSWRVQYKNLPMIGDKLNNDPEFRDKTENRSKPGEGYCVILDNCQPQIGAIFSALAVSENTTVFHCYAGKDRTGMIAAMLLSIHGVSDATIAEDYAETTNHIQHLVEGWRAYAMKHGGDMAKVERDASAAPETILYTLAHLRQKYGSILQYLRVCGVSETEIRQIQARFV
jgi:protein-tyrosine phosphatase